MNPAFLPRALTAGLLALLTGLTPARAETLDKVSFGTDRPVGPEQGGFYQALVDGTYKSYGLDVSIVPAAVPAGAEAVLWRGLTTDPDGNDAGRVEDPAVSGLPVVGFWS